MPYKNLRELPENVRDPLPLEAQRIYASAFNCAWEQYRALGSEQGVEARQKMADQVAWTAVSAAYQKDRQNDTWHLKMEQ